MILRVLSVLVLLVTCVNGSVGFLVFEFTANRRFIALFVRFYFVIKKVEQRLP